MRESSEAFISHSIIFFLGSIGFLVVVFRRDAVPVVKPIGSGGGIASITK